MNMYVILLKNCMTAVISLQMVFIDITVNLFFRKIFNFQQPKNLGKSDIFNN